MAILAWRPRAQDPPAPVGLMAQVPGLYAGRARFRPVRADELPAILRAALGRVVELGFAGFAPASDPFAGQKLYLEWCTDEVFGGFLIPEQDLEFLKRSPDPQG
jgi:hypothetical protein